jgi:hypothetical protein
MNLAVTPTEWASFNTALDEEVAQGKVKVSLRTPTSGQITYRGATFEYGYDGAAQATATITAKKFPASLESDETIYEQVAQQFTQWIAAGTKLA